MDEIQKALLSAGRKDLAQIYYKKMAASNPQSEYRRQSREIENNLKNINTAWENIKRSYENNLRSDPTSWAGIGRGSELGNLNEQMKELAEWLVSWHTSR